MAGRGQRSRSTFACFAVHSSFAHFGVQPASVPTWRRSAEAGTVIPGPESAGRFASDTRRAPPPRAPARRAVPRVPRSGIPPAARGDKRGGRACSPPWRMKQMRGDCGGECLGTPARQGGRTQPASRRVVIGLREAGRGLAADHRDQRGARPTDSLGKFPPACFSAKSGGAILSSVIVVSLRGSVVSQRPVDEDPRWPLSPRREVHHVR